ncbi:hypothetical protein [Methanococcus maripaludis]|uniref:Uncharacterized protein n=4 Tax=Methanococcus maripaludis TaxID=39152 RepID=A0A8T3W417_METMI|nr:hypothetical protein [Methanococcus maripaludis]MDK2928544.1 hypothetical protein [Methanococcus sp.]AEK19819.1 hypothetical protein GYY_04740 [Methanococcus maripaludis X1]MBG0768392.1 hypothetical protein [Methanococcus maripaludis]BAP61018.1 hypothetical protein MMKA1_09010 [Methanococcus maripaludis KA1]BAP62965.1 hypothetical protein MMOS7_08790 [Methanococcus maripaludis OS7]
MINLEKIKNFRDLIISKKELLEAIPFNPPKEYRGDRVEISTDHVIHILEKYKTGEVSKTQILDWVNTIWFSEWYDYCEIYSDSIASVMDELEELDEEGTDLTVETVDRYIYALQNNIEVWKLEKDNKKERNQQN